MNEEKINKKKINKKRIITLCIMLSLLGVALVITFFYDFDENKLDNRILDIGADYLKERLEFVDSFTVSTGYSKDDLNKVVSNKTTSYEYNASQSGTSVNMEMSYLVGAAGDRNVYYHNGSIKSNASTTYTTYPNQLENFTQFNNSIGLNSEDVGWTFRVYQADSIYAGLSMDLTVGINITGNTNLLITGENNYTIQYGDLTVDLTNMTYTREAPTTTPLGEELQGDQAWIPVLIYNTSTNAYYEATRNSGGDFFWEYIVYIDPTFTSTVTNVYEEDNISISNGNSNLARLQSNEPRLKLYWTLDMLSNPLTGATTTPDFSGNGRTGTVASAAVDVVQGLYGNATRFNTTSNEYIYSRTETLQTYNITDAYTMSAWINPLGASTAGSPVSGSPGGKIISRGHGSGGVSENFGMFHAGRSVSLNDQVEINEIGCVFMNQSNQIRTLTSTTLVNPNTGWHHVVCTYNGTEGRVYIDSVFNGTTLNFAVANQRITGLINTASAFLTVGRHLVAANESFNGTIDDVRIYNYSMNSSDILLLYQNNSKTFKHDGYVPFQAKFHETGNFNFANASFSTGSWQAIKSTNFSIRMVSWYPDAFYNKNHTNLVFFVPLDNRSAIGENSTKVVDIDSFLNGTITNPAPFVPSLYNKGLQMGSGTRVDFNDVSFDEGITGLTVVAFVNKTASSVSSTARIITQHGNSDTSSPFRMSWGLNSNKYRCTVRGTSNTMAIDSAASDTTVGNRVMIACVFTGNRVSLYKNGVLDASSLTVASQSTTSTTDDLEIGGSGNEFPGVIDNVMIFNRTLTDGEIWSLYAIGNIDAMENSAGLNLTVSNRIYTNLTTGNTTRIGVNPDANYTAPVVFFSTPVNNSFYTPILRNSTITTILYNEALFGDGDPPVVFLRNPANNSVVFTSTYFFGANFTDNALTKSSFQIWNSTGNLINQTNTSIVGSYNETNLSFTFPYAGIFKWNYFAVDNNNNFGYALSNFTINYTGSCYYSGSGNWNVLCNENCSISNQFNVTGNISTSGNGFINVTRNVSFGLKGSNIFISPRCDIYVNRGTGFGQ